MSYTRKFVQIFLSTIILLSMSLTLDQSESASALTTNDVSIQANTFQSKSSLPGEFLSPDGSLKLDGSFSGSIDLRNWNVQIDLTRGPIFAPAKSSQSVLPQGWSALGTANFGDGPIRDSVWAIAISGSDVYVGGFFTDVRNTANAAADFIAKWDGTNWSALGSNGAGGGSLNNFVTSIAIIGSDIYVGGAFENINNNGTILTAADYVAKWDGTNWSALGSDGAGNGSLLGGFGSVRAIAASGNNLYVGGGFLDVNNNGTILTAADYIAKWDGTNWSALGSNGAGNGSLNGVPETIAASGNNVYAGGFFTNVNNSGTILTAADYIAKWDGTNWSALGSNGAGDGSLSNTVYAIALSGSDVYVGGIFMNVNNNGTVLDAADWIAKWNGMNWSALGSNGAGNGPIQGSVLGIAVSGGNVYAGGYFTDIIDNGTFLDAADHIAKWDGTNWSALGSNGAGEGSLSNAVWEVAASGSNIYAGGDFTDVNNSGTVLTAADHFAMYSAEALSVTNIQVDIAGSNVGSDDVPLHGSARLGFPGIDNGPVQVKSADDTTPILAALRVIWKEPGPRTSYSEMMGLPVEALSSEYWFPWYNNLDKVSMDQGFRIANVSDSDTTIKVMLGTTQLDSFTLGAGASVRKSYEVNNGPIRIYSEGGHNILAALRVIWKEPGSRFSYSEMMGLPVEQLSTEYWFPWYNNAAINSMDQGFRIATVNAIDTNTIQVWIGDSATPQETLTLAAGASTRVGYNADNGPVRIVCTTCTGNEKIITSLRVIWKEPGFRATYSEMMGLPKEQLSTEYWFPWYNNLDTVAMDQGFRIANVDDSPHIVRVFLGAIQVEADIHLDGGGSRRVDFNVNSGPIRIVCIDCTNPDDKIIAALRIIWQEPGYRSSYSEMMGMPVEALSSEYWFPWYNFAAPGSMDQGFRIAVP